MSKTRNELRRLRLLLAIHITLSMFVAALLLYCYITTQHSSDELQQATYSENTTEQENVAQEQVAEAQENGATDSDADAGEVAHDKEEARMPEFGYDYEYVALLKLHSAA